MFELDLSLRPDNKRKLETACEQDLTKRSCAAQASTNLNPATKTYLKHPHAGILREYGGVQKYISTVISGRMAEIVESL